LPGDPKECRKHALRCAELAHSARTPELKNLLIELSGNWLKIAIELERAHLLLNIDDPPSIVPHKKPT
jgi:hypothetical protein